MANIKQQESKDCGIACLASIGQHYGLYLPQSKIRAWAQTDLQGTNLLGMLHAATQMGFEGKALRGTVGQLNHLPLPAIAHGMIEKNLSHFVVIQQVHTRYVRVMDPLVGETIKMSWSEFEAFWSGVVLRLQPMDSFKPHNDIQPMYHRMWEYVKAFWLSLLGTWLAGMLYTLLGLSMSFFIQQISDVIIPQRDISLLREYALMMLVILLLQFGCLALKFRNTLYIGKRIDQRLTQTYFQHLLSLPQSFFDTHRVGDMLSRISDAVKIRHFMSEVLVELFMQASVVICAYGILFRVKPLLAWYMTALLPIYALIYYLSNRKNKKLERQVMEGSARLENHWVESLSKVRTLKLFGAEVKFVEKGRRLMDSLLDTVQDSKRINFSTELLAQGIRSLFTLFLLWKGGEFVMHEALSIGELFALFALYGYFSGPIAQLVQANQAIQSARIAGERLHDILDQETEELGQSMPKALQKEIRIQQVGFRFGFRKSILEGVDLAIPLGSYTGVVGESGSGKSTLLKLFMKIYTPQSGKILWDDEDIQTISGVALRKKMAFVPQEIELFEGNFYSNIALGDANPNLERIRHVAEITGLQEIIERLPHGYETGLGENGMALSGGQKQRLGIARAFYLLPEVILLDEATAWLDSSAERKILQLIRSQIRTVVCISHRLTQFQEADCIHVIQAGTVIESGTHADLMQKVGAYFNLYSKQNGELV